MLRLQPPKEELFQSEAAITSQVVSCHTEQTGFPAMRWWCPPLVVIDFQSALISYQQGLFSGVGQRQQWREAVIKRPVRHELGRENER